MRYGPTNQNPAQRGAPERLNFVSTSRVLFVLKIRFGWVKNAQFDYPKANKFIESRPMQKSNLTSTCSHSELYLLAHVRKYRTFQMHTLGSSWSLKFPSHIILSDKLCENYFNQPNSEKATRTNMGTETKSTDRQCELGVLLDLSQRTSGWFHGRVMLPRY